MFNEGAEVPKTTGQSPQEGNQTTPPAAPEHHEGLIDRLKSMLPHRPVKIKPVSVRVERPKQNLQEEPSQG